MFKKGILLDVILFVGIVLLLLIVIPIISSILKQLIILQIIIAIVGAVALRYLVQKIRNKVKE
jgi:threonine/homoserine/homoserine lactone efflux protein